MILALLLLTATFSKLDVSLLWRQIALHDTTHLTRAYRAPLLGCELPGVVHGSYCVFLHRRCSLEEHKRTVGEEADLDSKISHLFPATQRHGLYYCAGDIDDEILDAIRADITVDMVEYNRSPEIDIGETIEVFERVEL